MDRHSPVCASNRFRTFLLLSLALLLPSSQAAPVPGEAATAKNRPAPARLEIRFTDGSVLKLKMLDENFTLKTPYGKLVVPFADINEIDCATHIPEDAAKKV